MKKYNVLFLIDYFDKNAGASMALMQMIENDKNISEYLVLATRIGNIPKDFNIRMVNSYRDILPRIKNQSFDFIHYYKSAGYNIFSYTIRALKHIKNTLPIITTVCQQPDIKNLLLSPQEINNSNLLVFIDKTAYNCPLLTFVPNNKKRFTYLGSSDGLIEKTKDILNNSVPKTSEKIVFGRGSTLNKCHKDFIDIYNSINIKNKCFEIVGINDEKALNINQDDIHVTGVLSMDNWLKKCSEFDIFLYILPENAYSSIDGTLGHAMLLEKPVVYYGPNAPKERIVNGVNGYIANNISEIAPICEELVKNWDKAKECGRMARIMTIRDFNWKNTIAHYNSFYKELQLNKDQRISIPLDYRFYYLKNNWKRLLKFCFTSLTI